MSHARRTSRGFTLIELVLVMLIIGLLLAVVAPSLGGLMRSQKLDGAARTIASLLKEARVRAASEARPYRLVIDPDENEVWLEVLTAEGFERPASSVGRIIELDPNLTFELEGGETENQLLTVRVEPDGIGQLAQVTLIRSQDDKQLAVYCRTPTEPYIIGTPVTLAELESGADDVDIDD